MRDIVNKSVNKMWDEIMRATFIADLHVGSPCGATPPEWQFPVGDSNSRRHKFAILQKETWEWIVKTAKRLQPIDVLVVNGDSLDGVGYKTDGVEQITCDRIHQIDMAVRVIREFKAKKIFMTHGTEYHGGFAEDWEVLLADKLGCDISDSLFLALNGVNFNIRHAVSGAGAATLSREFTINNDEYLRGTQPLADIIVRSHRHKYIDVHGPRDNTRAFCTPGLQGPGSKFGRRFSSSPDVGILSFDIKGREDCQHTLYRASLDSMIAKTEVVSLEE